MEQKKQRMQELVQLLNQAGKAYYQDAKEIMAVRGVTCTGAGARNYDGEQPDRQCRV